MNDVPIDVQGQIKKYPNLYEWVSTLEQKLDCIMSGYFTTNYDQTTVFYGQLFSFAYTIAHHGSVPYLCAEKVKEDLSQLLERYFKSNDVSVTYKDVPGSENRYTLEIKVGVSDTNTDRLDTDYIVETDGSTFAKIINTLNTQTDLDIINKKRQERAYEY